MFAPLCIRSMVPSICLGVVSFALLLIIVVPSSTDAQRPSSDTIFSRGGTCMYKIQPEYESCMKHQNSRLVQEKDALAPIYSYEALEASVNRISCCAYWEFVDCVREIVIEKCPATPVHDVEAYVRQIGSAVPVDICLEQFPRDSEACRPSGGLLSLFGGRSSASTAAAGQLPVLVMVLAIIIPRLVM